MDTPHSTLPDRLRRIVDTSARNIRYAVRTFGRRPGFALTVVLTLALGIGANTAVFSALDAVLLRPLPFPEPDRLVSVSQVNDRSSDTGIAPSRLEDWNAQSSAFAAIAGYYVEDISETSGDLPERVRRATVTPRFLEVLGIEPSRGRRFTETEHRFGGPSAIIISDRYWRHRFDADPAVLGRTVQFGTWSAPIVGVMPAGFRFPERDIDMWMPVSVDAPYAQTRQSPWYTGVGRLGAGATLPQAHANLAAVQARLGETYPETDRDVGVRLVPLKQNQTAGAASSLWLLFGAVSMLLLIACTNIVAVLLARAAHRNEEIAVRMSLGASRSAVTAQLLTETGVLAVAGGFAGVLFAATAFGVLRAVATDVPWFDDVGINGRVLLYTLAATMVVTLLCGLLPALSSARRASLRHASGRTVVSARTSVHWTLVGAQVALSVVLLTGAGLLVRSFNELSKVDPGFDTGHVVSFRVSGNWGETTDYDRLVQRIDGTIEALEAMVGVDAAATSGWTLPGVPAQWAATFELVESATAGQQPLVAETRSVSPAYFATMRIPLLAGEGCGLRVPAVGSGAPVDMLVNRAFVSRYLSEWSSPVGLHLRTTEGFLSDGRIAGVVGDAREAGLDRVPGPTVYMCFSAPTPTPFFIVRTRVEPTTLVPAIRSLMKEREPHRAVYDIALLDERIDEAFATNRLRMLLLALFAGTALALACAGLYGTLSYSISLRRREVGLRLALGALRRGIVARFLGHALGVVGLACILGIAVSMASARLLAAMLYGVSPVDPITLAAVIGIVFVVASLAVLIPALRAGAVEPMQVLRDQ